ncbi:HsdM family class I SAM-dependent methyltransferase [Stieleria varia]|uniref:site-specific DNA-methyltransferase (adenine-specific) n=1 Tax=Stieleria varia TaxID=2528005 RepID=A0A5C6B761_9BACT|nr:N-6 DNA methylase [Stieleria varia]TWU07828.1 N-6 DNA Methylase [Stieleria varia]
MKLSTVKTQLVACGYRPDWLRHDYRFRDDQTVKPLVGFAQLPFDARSSCIAVLESEGDPRREVEQCRATGAPLVFVCTDNSLLWWTQGVGKAQFKESISEDRVEEFFKDRKDDFSPNAIYRAKTWGRFRSEFQLSFVDAGLMPLVEEEVGTSLERLIERNVTTTKSRLGWDAISEQQGHWLLKSVFWLVSAKILRDKEVPNFEQLDLLDVDAVFAALAGHYGTPAIPISSKAKHNAIALVAQDIARFSNLAMTTTEALAYVYENTLISKATRAELGTHSTPAYLVDYIVGHLSDWIQEIPEENRSVFEPACGHAAFLVSAMRLLTELLPENKATPGRRRQYLRKRIHGLDKDAFALELARLALTLTDLPNPDGWDLEAEDMFLTDDIETQAKSSTIVLANPPFENFSETELQHYAARGAPPTVHNKAVEMLRRTLANMQPGSVFGFVMPQSMLHGRFARDVRKSMLEDFELREISLFADNVFSFADVESAVLIGRRTARAKASSSKVLFQRVREWEMDRFRSAYESSNPKHVPQTRFVEDNEWDMRVPDLEEVWSHLAENVAIAKLATMGKGLEYKGKFLEKGSETISIEPFGQSVQGFAKFSPPDVALHSLPTMYFMSLDEQVIRRPQTGTTTCTPQLLVNYAPVSRGPWRLKALLDEKGHPVTSRFITVRSEKLSLQAVWAILNSPIANAFAFSYLGKRDNIVGVMRKIPMPSTSDFAAVHAAVDRYFDAARSDESAKITQQLLAEVDAAVLRQYNLPIDLEYQLLSLFDGWDRLGVPFKQSVLLPKSLAGKVRFSDFVRYEKDWRKTNRRRGHLIDKKIDETITKDERMELEGLQAYAEYYLDRETPLPMGELEKAENLLLASAANKGDER